MSNIPYTFKAMLDMWATEDGITISLPKKLTDAQRRIIYNAMGATRSYKSKGGNIVLLLPTQPTE